MIGFLIIFSLIHKDTANLELMSHEILEGEKTFIFLIDKATSDSVYSTFSARFLLFNDEFKKLFLTQNSAFSLSLFTKGSRTRRLRGCLGRAIRCVFPPTSRIRFDPRVPTT